MARENLQVRVGATGLANSIRREAQRAEAQLARQPIRLNLDTKGFRQPLGRITHDVSEFNKSMDASVARVLAFGAAMAVMNAVSNSMKAMVQGAIKVEKALKDVNVILNLNNSQLSEFGDKLFDVARKTSQSFDTVSEAAVEFARQGLGAEETLKRINDAMILSRLSGLKATESVSSLTAAVNSYAKVGVTTTQVINRLANVDAAFAVSSADLASAIQRAGASAQGAKVKFNELLAVVTSVQQQTARGGAVIGNAFKSIFTRLQRSGVRSTLEEIGVATENTNGSLRSGLQVLKDYAKVYTTLTDQQRAYTDQQIAGLFQINNLKALLADLTSEYSIYDKALRTADTSTNQAIQRNEELNKTLGSLLLRTGASIDELAAKLGELGATEGISKLVNMVKGVADFLNDLLGTGENEGNSFAKNLVRGIGGFLTGPGLVIVGAALAKIFGQVSKFGVSAFKEILGLNVETKRQDSLQKAIGATLSSNEKLYAQIMGLAGNTAQQEQVLLNYIKQETKERLAQEAIMKRIASSTAFIGVGAGEQGFVPAGKRGARKIGKKTLGMSTGFVPNFRRSPAQSAEYMGMVSGGYSKKALRNPKIKKTKIHDGKGRSFWAQTNGAENIKTFSNLSGKKATMVVPEKQSDAYKAFSKKLKKKMAASGFVPNFAKMPKNFLGTKASDIRKDGANRISTKEFNATNLVSMLVPDSQGSHPVKGGVTMPEGHIQRVKFMKVGPKKHKGGVSKDLDKITRNQMNQGSKIFANLLDKNMSKGPMSPFGPSEVGATAGRIFEKAVGAVLKSPSFGTDTATFDFIGGDRSKGGVFDWKTQLADAKSSNTPSNRTSMAKKTIEFVMKGAKGWRQQYKGDKDQAAVSKIQRDVEKEVAKTRVGKEDATGRKIGKIGARRFGWRASGGYVPSFFDILGGTSNMGVDHLGPAHGMQKFQAPPSRMEASTGNKMGKNFWRAMDALGVTNVSRSFNLTSHSRADLDTFKNKTLPKNLRSGNIGDIFEAKTAYERYGGRDEKGKLKSLKLETLKAHLSQASLPFDSRGPGGSKSWRGGDGRIGEAKALDIMKGKSAAGTQADVITKSLFSDSDRGLFNGVSEKLTVGNGKFGKDWAIGADGAKINIPGKLATEMKAAGYDVSGNQASRAEVKRFAKASLLGYRKAYNQRKVQNAVQKDSPMFQGKLKLPSAVPFPAGGRGSGRFQLAARRRLSKMGASGGYVPNFALRTSPMKPPSYLVKMAEKIHAAGGKAQIIGGAPRDHLLGMGKGKPKDWDVEVFGLQEKALRSMLGKNVSEVGKDFGVFKVNNRGTDYDFSMPRAETSTGRGHRDFKVKKDPFMSELEAAKRRDLTVNAISYNPLTKKFSDAGLGGMKDLEAKIMRPTSAKFMEDPLRVMRAMQFAGRFGFSADAKLIEYSKAISGKFNALPKERVRDEWYKWATKSKDPSKGLDFLEKSGWMKHFPELGRLSGIKQSPKWHPEGNVFEHTKMVVDQMTKRKVWKGWSDEKRFKGTMSALLHDIGKYGTTVKTPKGVASPGHAEKSVKDAEAFLQKIMPKGEAKRLAKAIGPEIGSHMFHVNLPVGNKAIGRMKRKGVDLERLIALGKSDVLGRGPQPKGARGIKEVRQFEGQVNKMGVTKAAVKRLVTGNDLKKAGLMEQGPRMKPVLNALEDAQLSGQFSTTAEGLKYAKRHLGLSGGYVPNFGYMSKGIRQAINREQSMSGQKAVVERSRFLDGGVGVYNKAQQRKYGSLDRTIQRDHLAQGQRKSTLGETGSGKERYAAGGFVPTFARGAGRPQSLSSYVKKEMVGRKFGDLNKMVSNSWQSRVISGQGLSMAAETSFKNGLFSSIAGTFKGGMVPIGSNPTITAENWAKVPRAKKLQLQKKWEELNLGAPKPAQPVYNSDEQFYKDMLSRRANYAGGYIPNFAGVRSFGLQGSTGRELAKMTERERAIYVNETAGKTNRGLASQAHNAEVFKALKKRSRGSGMGKQEIADKAVRAYLKGGVPARVAADAATSLISGQAAGLPLPAFLLDMVFMHTKGLAMMGKNILTGRKLTTGLAAHYESQLTARSPLVGGASTFADGHVPNFAGGLFSRWGSKAPPRPMSGGKVMRARRAEKLPEYPPKGYRKLKDGSSEKIAPAPKNYRDGQGRLSIYERGSPQNPWGSAKGHIPNFIRSSRARQGWNDSKAERQRELKDLDYAKWRPGTHRKSKSHSKMTSSEMEAQRTGRDAAFGRDVYMRSAGAAEKVSSFNSRFGLDKIDDVFQGFFADGHVPNFAAMRIGKFGGIAGSKFQMADLLKRSPFRHQLTRYGHWDNFPPEVKQRLSKWLLKKGISNRGAQTYTKTATGVQKFQNLSEKLHLDKIDDVFQGFFAEGYIPNFAAGKSITQKINEKKISLNDAKKRGDKNAVKDFKDQIRNLKNEAKANKRTSASKKRSSRSKGGKVRRDVTASANVSPGVSPDIKERRKQNLQRSFQRREDRKGKIKALKKLRLDTKTTGGTLSTARRLGASGVRGASRIVRGLSGKPEKKAKVVVEKLNAAVAGGSAGLKESSLRHGEERRVKKEAAEARRAQAKIKITANKQARVQEARERKEKTREQKQKAKMEVTASKKKLQTSYSRIGKTKKADSAKRVAVIEKAILKVKEKELSAAVKTVAAADQKVKTTVEQNKNAEKVNKAIVEKEAKGKPGTQRRTPSKFGEGLSRPEERRQRPGTGPGTQRRTPTKFGEGLSQRVGTRRGAGEPKPPKEPKEPKGGQNKMGAIFIGQMMASMMLPYASDYAAKQKEGTKKAGAAKAGEYALTAGQFAPFLMFIPHVGIAAAALTVLASAAYGLVDGLDESSEELGERTKKDADSRRKTMAKQTEARQGIGQSVANLRQREKGTDAASIRTARDAVRKRLSGITDNEERKKLQGMIGGGSTTKEIMTELERSELKGSGARNRDAALSFLDKESYDNNYELGVVEKRDKIWNDSANSFASTIDGLNKTELKGFQDGLDDSSSQNKLLAETFEEMRNAQMSGDEDAAERYGRKFEKEKLTERSMDDAERNLANLGMMDSSQARAAMKSARSGESQEGLKKLIVAMREGNNRRMGSDFSESAEAAVGINRAFEKFNDELKFSEQMFKQYNSILNKQAKHQVDMWEKVSRASIDLSLEFVKGAHKIQENVDLFNIDFNQRLGSAGRYEAITQKFEVKREAMNRGSWLDQEALKATTDTSEKALRANKENDQKSLFRQYNQGARRTAIDQVFGGGENRNVELQAELKRKIARGEATPANVLSVIGEMTTERSDPGASGGVSDFERMKGQQKALEKESEALTMENAKNKAEFDKLKADSVSMLTSDSVVERRGKRMKAIGQGGYIATNLWDKSSSSDTYVDPADGRKMSREDVSALYKETEEMWNKLQAERVQGTREDLPIGFRSLDFVRGEGETTEARRERESDRATWGDVKYSDVQGYATQGDFRSGNRFGYGPNGPAEYGPRGLTQNLNEPVVAKDIAQVQNMNEWAQEQLAWEGTSSNWYKKGSRRGKGQLNEKSEKAFERATTLRDRNTEILAKIDANTAKSAKLEGEMPDPFDTKVTSMDQFRDITTERDRKLAAITGDSGPEKMALGLERGQISTAAAMKELNDDYNRGQQNIHLEAKKQSYQLEIQRHLMEEQLRVEEEQSKKLAALDRLGKLSSGGLTTTQNLTNIYHQANVRSEAGRTKTDQGKVMVAESNRKIAAMTGIEELFDKEDKLTIAAQNAKNMAAALKAGGAHDQAKKVEEDWEKTKKLIESKDVSGPALTENQKLNQSIKELTASIRGGLQEAMEQEVQLAVPEEMIGAMEKVETALYYTANAAFSFKEDLDNISRIFSNVAGAKNEREALKPLLDLGSEYEEKKKKIEQEAVDNLGTVQERWKAGDNPDYRVAVPKERGDWNNDDNVNTLNAGGKSMTWEAYKKILEKSITDKESADLKALNKEYSEKATEISRDYRDTFGPPSIENTWRDPNTKLPPHTLEEANRRLEEEDQADAKVERAVALSDLIRSGQIQLKPNQSFNAATGQVTSADGRIDNATQIVEQAKNAIDEAKKRALLLERQRDLLNMKPAGVIDSKSADTRAGTTVSDLLAAWRDPSIGTGGGGPILPFGAPTALDSDTADLISTSQKAFLDTLSTPAEQEEGPRKWTDTKPKQRKWTDTKPKQRKWTDTKAPARGGLKPTDVGKLDVGTLKKQTGKKLEEERDKLVQRISELKETIRNWTSNANKPKFSEMKLKEAEEMLAKVDAVLASGSSKAPNPMEEKAKSIQARLEEERKKIENLRPGLEEVRNRVAPLLEKQKKKPETYLDVQRDYREEKGITGKPPLTPAEVQQLSEVMSVEEYREELFPKKEEVKKPQTQEEKVSTIADMVKKIKAEWAESNSLKAEPKDIDEFAIWTEEGNQKWEEALKKRERLILEYAKLQVTMDELTDKEWKEGKGKDLYVKKRGKKKEVEEQRDEFELLNIDATELHGAKLDDHAKKLTNITNAYGNVADSLDGAVGEGNKGVIGRSGNLGRAGSGDLQSRVRHSGVGDLRTGGGYSGTGDLRTGGGYSGTGDLRTGGGYSGTGDLRIGGGYSGTGDLRIGGGSSGGAGDLREISAGGLSSGGAGDFREISAGGLSSGGAGDFREILPLSPNTPPSDGTTAPAGTPDMAPLIQEIEKNKEAVGILTTAIEGLAQKGISNNFDGNVAVDIPGMLTSGETVKAIWEELSKKLEANLFASLKEAMDERLSGGLFT